MPKAAIKAYCLFINMQFSGHDITDDAMYRPTPISIPVREGCT